MYALISSIAPSSARHTFNSSTSCAFACSLRSIFACFIKYTLLMYYQLWNAQGSALVQSVCQKMHHKLHLWLLLLMQLQVHKKMYTWLELQFYGHTFTVSVPLNCNFWCSSYFKATCNIKRSISRTIECLSNNTVTCIQMSVLKQPISCIKN